MTHQKIFTDGNWILLSSIKIKNLDSQSIYAKKLNSKVWGYNEGILQDMLLKLLVKIIPDKANKRNIIDIPLTSKEIESLKLLFVKETEKILKQRITPRNGFSVKILNQEIILDTKNNAKTDRLLYGYYNILRIIYECIEQNSPLYLTID